MMMALVTSPHVLQIPQMHLFLHLLFNPIKRPLIMYIKKADNPPERKSTDEIFRRA